MHHDDDHDDFGGLDRDLKQTGARLRRRDILRLAFGAGALHLLGCADGLLAVEDDVANGACARIPEETAGPYPGDGSNGPNVLTQTGVVRSDIRSSFAGLSGTAVGIPLTVTLTLESVASGCAQVLAGYAVYIWHCDREGRYSLYSQGVTNQNYLRGVQETDANGQVAFTTIFPACYAGRWPHIHFEVYRSIADATAGATEIATSQLALPESVCDLVYATTGYQQSVINMRGVSLASDGIFRDGVDRQMATMAGSVAAGYTAALTVGV